MGIDAEMFVRTKTSYTELEVRRLAVDLCEAFRKDTFCVSPPGRWDRKPGGCHALSIVSKYEQDGPDVLPEDGEVFIAVHLFGRYYGEGYERGDLPIWIMVAEWLEARIPGGEVWYGGDSSGVLAERFDREARKKLFEHFVKVGHKPYQVMWDEVMGSGAETCDFCAGSQLSACRWGPDGRGYICAGCGLHRLVKNNGTKTEAYDEWPDATREP